MNEAFGNEWCYECTKGPAEVKDLHAGTRLAPPQSHQDSMNSCIIVKQTAIIMVAVLKGPNDYMTTVDSRTE